MFYPFTVKVGFYVLFYSMEAAGSRKYFIPGNDSEDIVVCLIIMKDDMLHFSSNYFHQFSSLSPKFLKIFFMYSLYHILCVPQNLVRKLCTFYKGYTQDIVFCQRLQYDENGEKELFFFILEVSIKKEALV